jgi:diaminohydroxyphosphoribosylaminopyrimidine deaminase/5-amino-6-(5-phosphoribosylamino)uracil reductase
MSGASGADRVAGGAEDEVHMAHALRLAARGLGRCWPNPAVGCVIVRNGRVIGRGWTQPGGRPHAERRALDSCSENPAGASVYVTLEPCAHHGQTPPCAEALVAAGVGRVISALTDPDPRVSGRGHALLRGAGIAVAEGVLAAEAARLNAGFLKRVTRGLPLVTLKLATSLDGRIATASGESRWITGPQARARVQALRGNHDAVLVGSGTALADDPDLGLHGAPAARQPVRIVLDRRLALGPDSRLGRLAAEAPVWLVHGAAAPAGARQAWAARGATLIEAGEGDGGLDLAAALCALAGRGLTRVLCEGGGTLAAALLRAGLVDELALFTGAVLIGSEGRAGLGPLRLAALADALRPTLRSSGTIGPDVLSLYGL